MQPQQPQQPYQSTPVTYFIAQQPALMLQSAPPGDQYVWNFSAAAARVCGGLTIVMGLLCIGGAVTETVYAVTELQNYMYGVTTWNDYAGYWCGVILMSEGAIAAETGRLPTDPRIMTTLAGSLGAIASTSTLIALTVPVFAQYNLYTRSEVMLAAWATMVGAASVALLLMSILSVLCLRAIIWRKKVASTVAPIEMTTQQYYQQQQHLYNQYVSSIQQQQQQQQQYPPPAVHEF